MKLDPREARQILRQCDFAALATQSARLAGYPFVSHAPFVLDRAGRPLLLLSNLAEHTKNLAADPRASLMVSLPEGEPQAQPRLTLVGELRLAEVSPPMRDRYLRYQPDAATYLGFGDFHFYRMEVQAVRLISGFARAGWIAPAEWTMPPLAEVEEAVLLGRLQAHVPAEWRILGVDWEGMDAWAPGEGRLRLAWDPAATDEASLMAAASRALAARRTDFGPGEPD